MGVNGLPIRVASVQDFRRSMNSLNTVPESSRQQARHIHGLNQTFALNQQKRANTNTVGNRPMGSDNPLLKMMEERMAAKQKEKMQQVLPTIAASPSPELPPMSNENKTALQASINEWSGVNHRASPALNGQTYNNPVHPTQKMVVTQPASAAASPQLSGQGSPSSGRAPLSYTQMGLLQELAASQGFDLNKETVAQPDLSSQSSQSQMLQNLLLQQAVPGGMGASSSLSSAQQSSSQNEILQQLLLQQVTGGMGSNLSVSSAIHQQAGGKTLSHAQSVPSLACSAVSSAEVDRLRRENQIIQFRQQMAMQERAELARAILEQQNEQAYLVQRNVAASVLASMQNQQPQKLSPQPLTLEELNSMQVNALNQIKRQPSNDLKSSSGLSFRSSSCMRKRRSLVDADDDESLCSKTSLSSHTHSVTSSTSSSYKIHRSLSQTSARASIPGSMENLRIKSRHRLLSRGIIGSSSSSSGVNDMKNQSFSSNNLSSMSKRVMSPSEQQAVLRRSTSSNNWIKSLLTGQSSAGQAAATFEHALSTTDVASLLHKHNHQITTPSQENQQQEKPLEATIPSPKPIQVKAEEYAPLPIERPPSTSSHCEKVIISAVPDSIKYQNSKADTKPIDIVTGALTSRGLKCEIKPSLEMEDDFFVKVTAMYDQDIVNAIRSNDVENLRKLSESGVDLQCGNRFGETLIHLACRRSHIDLVSYLVDDASVSLHVRDDFGRTPMHDACWRAEPNLELLDMLLDRAPELLMLKDKRGHTPLDYARREHWAVLVPFLVQRADKFRPV